MNLRPYQTEAVERTLEALASHRSTLLELPTGTGKTVVFSHLANRWEGRVLILAHRDELIRQACEKIHAVTGEKAAVEMGLERAQDGPWMKAKCVVSSVQTMCRPSRREQFPPDEFGLVVVDEAHHSVAKSYRDVLDYFAPAKVLGVTATPKRADKLAMGQVFESVALSYGIVDAIRDGWLVPVRQQVIKCEELDFSKVRTTAGDFNEGDLEKILAEEKALHAVSAPLVEAAGDLPTLVFCVTVNHAQKMAEVLNRYRPHSAMALSGADDREVRRDWVERFRQGSVQFLCSCMIFTEGFDAPGTAVVAMARPTKSLPLYVQILGRGTRPLPGVVDPLAEGAAQARREAIAGSAKPSMLALDFVGNSGRHKIVTSYDVLGGKYGEPVRREAAKNAEDEGDGRPVEEGLERAADELAFAEFVDREETRRKQIQARARYHAREVSPFADGSVGDFGAPERVGPAGATEKQVWLLVKRFGVQEQTARGYSKRQASAVIDKLMKKANQPAEAS